MNAGGVERGARLHDEYRLLERLADPVGSTGAAWLALARASGKRVVLQIFDELDDETGARLLEAARRARPIEHRALARILELGQQDGKVFLVSEPAKGHRLAQWTERAGIPPLERAVAIVLQVCRGLAAAHRAGLAHDALSTHEVFVEGPAERDPPAVTLVDLAIGACVRSWPPSLATAQYFAPEQLAASHARAQWQPASAAMNQYSCGAILYDLCTGGPPYSGATLQELQASHDGPSPVPPSRINPQVPAALDEVILRALRRDPDQRFASLDELREALGSLRLSNSTSGVRLLTGMSSPAPGGFQERPTMRTPLPLAMTLVRASEPGAAAEQVVTDPYEADTLRPPPALGRPPAPSGPSAHGPSGPSGRSGSKPPPIGSFSGPLPAPPPRRGRNPLDAASTSPPPAPAGSAEASIGTEPRTRRAGARKRPSRRLLAVAALGVLGVLAAVVRLANAPAGEVDATPLAPLPDAPATSVPAEDTVPQAAPPAVAREPVDPPNVEPSADPPRVLEPAPPAEPPAATAPRRAPPERSAQAKPPRPTRSSPPRSPPRARSASNRASADPPEPAPVLDEPAQRQEEPTPPAGDDAPPAQATRQDSPARADDEASADPSRTKPPRALAPEAVSRPAPPAQKSAPARTPAPFSAEAVSLRISGLSVRGSLPSSVVLRGIDRIRTRLRDCYREAAGRAGRHGYGALEVSLEIDEHGRARRPRARGARLPGLDACVQEAARRIAARHAPDTGTVSTSFRVEYAP